MFFNYLKTAFRNLKQNKNFAFMNVLGLTIGITSCLLIFMVVQFELSFDNYHKKKDRIYRVVTKFNRAGVIDWASGVSRPVAEALRRDFPQLESVAAIDNADSWLMSVTNDNGQSKKFENDIVLYAEPQLFNVLDVKWLTGDPEKALSEPNTAVLSKTVATKYFGDWREAIGKLIKHNNNQVLKVSGVIDDVPVNSDFPLKVLISYKTSPNANDHEWNNTSSGFNCLIVLPKEISPKQFDKMLPAFRDKYAKSDNAQFKLSYQLQPLNTIHFDNRFGNYNYGTFSKELITTLSLIGIFLLVIACVNFINLATAQAVNRSKEIGVRKVLGGRRMQLIMQFLGETFIITVMATAIACLLTTIILPYLNKLLGISFSISNDRLPMIAISLFIVVAAVTLLSGFYPALILSGFNPINALKSKVNAKSTKGISIRRGLVIFQFAIAQILIIGTLVVVSQMNFINNASMGFDKNAIVTIGFPGDTSNLSKVLKQQLLNQPGIENVSFSMDAPASDGNWTSDFTFNKSPKPTSFEASLKWADADYFKTYGLQLIAGRIYAPSDTVREFVANETLLKKLGIKDPHDALGKEISLWNRRLHGDIVGVVKDFHNNSLRDPISPVLISTRKRNYSTIGIKIQMNKAKEVLAGVEKLWNEAFPDYVYRYKFLDKQIADFYDQEGQLSKLYSIFAGIAIFISCLGLYGLVSFMAVQRTKEIGIRKVLGASVKSIIYLFSKEFTILIGMAFLVATPLAYYFMHQWLNNFSFRIDLGLKFFILAIAGSMLIAWITVGYKAIKAGLANPVKSLRSE